MHCLLLATLFWACQVPTDDTFPSSADEVSDSIVVSGGTVVTFDSADRVIDAGAVAVVGGRIAAVGPAAEIEPLYPEADRIDAAGGIILPGLINAHTHVPMSLFRGLADDLELMDWLEGYIFPAEAEHVDEEFVRWGTRLACLEMLRGGITTFVDMYYHENVIAEEADLCGIRAVVGETLIDFPAPDNATWDEAVAYTRGFVERWRGHERVTPAVAPHSAYTVSGEHLVAAHRLAEELDVPLLIHVAEDRAEIERVQEATGLATISYLEELGILDDRMVAAHVVWPTPDEIELLAERGVGVAHRPESNMKVAAGIAPVPAMLAAGVAVGIGTDGAGSNNNLDLLDEIDTAAKLHKVASGDPTAMGARKGPGPGHPRRRPSSRAGGRDRLPRAGQASGSDRLVGRRFAPTTSAAGRESLLTRRLLVEGHGRPDRSRRGQGRRPRRPSPHSGRGGDLRQGSRAQEPAGQSLGGCPEALIRDPFRPRGRARIGSPRNTALFNMKGE